MARFEFSATTGSSNLGTTTAWTPLEAWLGSSGATAGAPTGSPNLAPQGLSIQVTSPTAAAAANFAVAWVYESMDGTTFRVVKYKAGTIAATAIRTSKSGSANDYVCDVTIDGVANGVLDLLPFGEDSLIKVYIGVTTLSVGASIDFVLNTTRVV